MFSLYYICDRTKKHGKNDNEIEIIANDRYCEKTDFFRYNPIVFWNTQFGSSFVN